MGIINGKYISPIWRNGQRPYIGASELNALSGTLQGAQTKIGDVILTRDSSYSDLYLPCDGTTFSATDYPELYAALGGNTLPFVQTELGSAYIKAASPTYLDVIAYLIKIGKLSDYMTYGDKITEPWSAAGNNYSPAFNLVAYENGELESGDTVPTAVFEWEGLLPFTSSFSLPFDEPEAIYAFDGTEGVGTFYIGIGTGYGGWNTSKHIQFTLSVAPDAGDQLVIDLNNSHNTDPTNNRTWNLYARGSTMAKDTGTTSNGTSGTNLGSTSADGTQLTNGKVNSPARAAYGYNRWSQSAMRQYLNSSAAEGAWWSPQNDWDRPPQNAATLAGFLAGYSANVASHFQPCRNVTVAYGNVEDVTFDKVFIASVEQIYVTPDNDKEGAFFPYYKQLLNRNTPAPARNDYPVLIKKAITTSGLGTANTRFLRSALSSNSYGMWRVNTVGNPNYTGSTSYANLALRVAPCVRIG